jgi:hypothetical protein
MRLSTATTLYAYGTSEGVQRAWDTRGRGRAPRSVSIVNRSALSKQFSVPVTSDKIQGSADSVNALAKAIGGTVTDDHHPWDVLKNGTKIGIEVKRFYPGRKNMKATIHSGKDVTGARSQGSKERKIEFADKSGMKRMYLVVHDTTTPGKERWFARRVGDRNDPRGPKGESPGWSFNTFSMHGGGSKPESLKGLLI